MSLFLLGVNYKTAPLYIREKASFACKDIARYLKSAINNLPIEGVVLLSTCNRTEIYLSADNLCKYQVFSWWQNMFYLDDNLLEDCYWHEEIEVAWHLMQVSSGLASLVLGEAQIMGQVKYAFDMSKKASCLNAELCKLFESAFKASKLVRTGTKISKFSSSFAAAVKGLIQNLYQNTLGLNVLCIGAGSMATLMLRNLSKMRFNNLYVVNRTFEKAKELSKSLDIDAYAIEDLPKLLREIDVVISAVSTRSPVIKKSDLEILSHSQKRIRLIVDLSVPHAVEPSVRQLPFTKLYQIDDLQGLVQSNMENAKIEAEKAKNILKTELDSFSEQLASFRARKLIADYRSYALDTCARLTNEALRAIDNGKDVSEVLPKLTNRLTKVLLHPPTQALHRAAQEDDRLLTLLHNSLKTSGEKSNE